MGERSREKNKATWGGVVSIGAGSSEPHHTVIPRSELVFWDTMKIRVSFWQQESGI